MGTGQAGPLRLADQNMAGQIMWFLPLTLLGLWVAFRKEESEGTSDGQSIVGSFVVRLAHNLCLRI